MPTTVQDPRTQECLDTIARQFPISAANLAATARTVTELPAKGTVGQQIIFKVETGIYWNLLYTAEETYPWAKIGGPALRAFDAGGPRNTGSAVPQTTGAPSITVPLAMEFRAHFGARWVQRTAATGAPDSGRTCLFVNAVEKDFNLMTAPGQFDAASTESASNPWTIAAGQVVQTRYRSEAGAAFNFEQLIIEVDPLRVG